MNITERTCANCAAFNPTPTDDNGPCENLVCFTDAGAPREASRDSGPGDYCHHHQTVEEDAAETEAIEVTRKIEESTPGLLEAVGVYLELVETLGMDHPNSKRALMPVMSMAPPSTNDLMADKARELGLMPEADGYTDDGEPVFNLISVAAKLGIEMEEAQQAIQAIQAMLAERGELGLPTPLVDPATVHRKQ